MPKQVLKIEKFEGGLNTNSNKRDIADNELASSKNIMVDEVGRLRIAGFFKDYTEIIDGYEDSVEVQTLQPGYGLFSFSHDQEGAELGNFYEGEQLGNSSSGALEDGVRQLEEYILYGPRGNEGNQSMVGAGVPFPTTEQLIGCKYINVTPLRGNGLYTTIRSNLGADSQICWEEHEIVKVEKNTQYHYTNPATYDFTENLIGQFDHTYWSRGASLPAADIPLAFATEVNENADYISDFSNPIFTTATPHGISNYFITNGMKVKIEGFTNTFEETDSGGNNCNNADAYNHEQGGYNLTYQEEYATGTGHAEFRVFRIDDYRFLVGSKYFNPFNFTCDVTNNDLILNFDSDTEEGGAPKVKYMLGGGHPLQQSLLAPDHGGYNDIAEMRQGDFLRINIAGAMTNNGQGDNYLALANTSGNTGGTISIVSLNSKLWGEKIVRLGSAVDIQPNYTYIDGKLYIADSNFSEANLTHNRTKIFGFFHLKANSQAVFGGWSAAIKGWAENRTEPMREAGLESGGWFEVDYRLESPESIIPNIQFNTFNNKGIKAISTMINPLVADDWVQYTPEKPGQILLSPQYMEPNSEYHLLNSIFPEEGTGTWNIKGRFNLYASYIYDNGEESKLLDFSKDFYLVSDLNGTDYVSSWANSSNTGASLSALVASITINSEDLLNGPRCKGVAFYWNDSAENTSIKYFLCEASIEKGVRAGLSVSYTPWTKLSNWHANHEGTYNDRIKSMLTADFTLEDESRELTYESRNGYRDDEDLCYNWKTAVFANRRLYVGNVFVNGIMKSDTMLKSPANKPGILPLSGRVDVVVGDGDSIVALSEFADRVLQFKERVMYIINISGSAEYLEEKHDFKGIKHPQAVCKTDYGVIWINENGCYAFDGERVQNLLEKEKKQLISPSDWSDFITDNSTIGYSSKDGHILIMKDCDIVETKEMYIYDIITESWAFANRLVGAPLCTNFVNDANGNLILTEKTNEGVKIKSYVGKVDLDEEDDIGGGQIEFYTKDFDFGNPAVRKKIYKIYVTYTAGASTDIDIYGYINGQSSAYSMDSSLEGTGGRDTQQITELKFTTPLTNIYSLQLKFIGEASKEFQINDISIVYRIKNVK